MLFTNVLAAISLIAGGWSIYVDPTRAWFLSFLGLAYPVILIINLFFLFFWIVVRLKYTLVSLIAIALTFPVLKSYFSFRLPGKQAAGAGDLKIMTYNLRNFDVYHWQQENNALDDIIGLIKNEHPSIAAFQEFYNADSGSYQTIRLIREQTGLTYFHFEKTFTGKNGQSWGIATFSRYPIVNHGNVAFENHTQNACSYADIRINTKILRVFNIHLQSIYLSKKDYTYLQEISEKQDIEVGPVKEIASKLKKAFLLRGKQALAIQEEIKKSPYPVIACGDFNDTPASFAYHQLVEGLNDTFLEAGWGLGPTYSGIFKNYRIDYILTGNDFEVRNYKTICVDYSDHRPVTSEVRMK